MKNKPALNQKRLADALIKIGQLKTSLREAEHAYAGMAEDLKQEKLNHQVHAAALQKNCCVLRVDNVSLRNVITEVRGLIDARRLPPIGPEDKPR